MTWPFPEKISALSAQTFRENTGADIVVETAPYKACE
jgi:hypothetical protein